MSIYLFDAELASTDLGRHVRATTAVSAAMAELFGDDFSRALYRETAYSVPDDQRLTCSLHLDWRQHCLDLHVDVKAAA